MKPSIGRIVLVPMKTDHNNGAPVAPAVVTRVWSDTMVNVRVLADSGETPAWRTSCTFAKSLDDATGNQAVWTWPQKVKE